MTFEMAIVRRSRSGESRSACPCGAQAFGTRPVCPRRNAFTLPEVIISLLILGIMVVGIVLTYIQAHRTAEWSSYSLAANAIAMKPVEQIRAAQWDAYRYPQIDKTTNVAMKSTNQLDLSLTGTNIVWATNRVVLTNISTHPPLKMIYVETTWTFMNRGVFTNSILTFRAPDQ